MKQQLAVVNETMVRTIRELNLYGVPVYAFGMSSVNSQFARKDVLIPPILTANGNIVFKVEDRYFYPKPAKASAQKLQSLVKTLNGLTLYTTLKHHKKLLTDIDNEKLINGEQALRISKFKLVKDFDGYAVITDCKFC